jgi:cytidyltransferase-like protein
VLFLLYHVFSYFSIDIQKKLNFSHFIKRKEETEKMSDFGIICEFNPIHNGHVRLINEARRLGAERIVCVMSGNAVQRGELSIADKYTRAEQAVRCGADLVLELPYPYSSASAEYFARAGVQILSNFVDSIIFGSECGDIGLLSRAAKAASQESFKTAVRERIDSGAGAGVAYFCELESLGFCEFSSNDILGMEYIRAAMESGANLNFFTVKREGARYLDTELKTDEAPSATALRKLFEGGDVNLSLLSKYMPAATAEALLTAYKNGELTDMRELDTAIITFFRLHNSSAFYDIAETGGGLSNRICTLAKECMSASELFERLKTKRYTDARLRRAMLFSMTGVTHSLLDTPPAYTVLLAANGKGREVLAQKRKAEGFPVITKPADAPKCEQTAANDALDAIFTLARKNKLEASAMMKKRAYVEDQDAVVLKH